jgi:hypothetical protein
VIFVESAPERSLEKYDAGKERRATSKEDKPCSGCGHLCSAHAPADYTRMHCNTEGCPCNGYFPSKSYETVVQENIALRREVAELKKELEPFTKPQSATAAQAAH